MSRFFTTNQVLDIARTEINRKIAEGKFTGNEGCEENEENFFTIESLYCQWAENMDRTSESLWEMFEEEFDEYFN